MPEKTKTKKVTTTRVNQVKDYLFEVTFDLENLPALYMDEPPPLGSGKGPNASRLVAAAIGNCLSASLLFCLQKWKAPIKSIKATVKHTISRNPQGYWRITNIDVNLHPILEEKHRRYEKCLKDFENYCITTESIRKGIPVNVKVTSIFEQ